MQHVKKLPLVYLVFAFNIICFSLHAQNTFPASGNVGIGTSSPSHLLDVRGGGIYTNGGLEIDGGDIYSSRIDQPYGYILRPNLAGYKNLQFACTGGNPLDIIALNSVTSVVYGNLGIGTITPAAKMDIYTGVSGSPQYGMLLHTGTFVTAANAASSYFLKMQDDGGMPATKFIVQGDGSVGINTMPAAGYTLSVNGSAIFTKAVVKLYTNWPDYVFKKNYPLTSLNNLADYIQKNEHLPGLPSAGEMQQNGQIDLGQMNVKLLEKIEELTLYMIELKNENSNMQKSNLIYHLIVLSENISNLYCDSCALPAVVF